MAFLLRRSSTRSPTSLSRGSRSCYKHYPRTHRWRPSRPLSRARRGRRQDHFSRAPFRAPNSNNNHSNNNHSNSSSNKRLPLLRRPTLMLWRRPWTRSCRRTDRITSTTCRRTQPVVPVLVMPCIIGRDGYGVTVKRTYCCHAWKEVLLSKLLWITGGLLFVVMIRFFVLLR